ncbi:HD-GYP domain-containing protein [Salibacterium halotolerans]|uniref:HD-GYP domain-containing protein n=1 Tax=Salibacterium halotolerans TaxID=1884432 RepID=A0A1I5KWD9_9BACI|nr:HD domain-containing phosphohydrolase [Salibacterium halotolerans]SFO89364.1 hypothetical protein SAMN05518683_10112 [Salibacterium halotolerans]
MGYPKGIKGKETHIFDWITEIADVFDALGSERVYKKAWSDEEIFSYFQEQKGRQFDPELMELFLYHFSTFTEIRRQHADHKEAANAHE